MPAGKLPAVREALLDLLWSQWHELGAPAARKRSRPMRSIVDPEALVLASLSMLENEPRLGDVLVSWCAANSQFLSVQRTNNLARNYSEQAQARLPALARVMIQNGKDLRWRPLSKATRAAAEVLTQRGPKQSSPVPLDRPAAFLLRVRTIFGLGLRPDVIVFLLRKGDPREYVDASEVARALGYNRTAIKRTLDLLVAAGALSITDPPDPGYAIGWSDVYQRLSKEIDQLPRWRYAHETFLWVIALLEAGSGLATGSEFLRELQMGRLLRQHRQFLVEDAGVFNHQTLRQTPSLDLVIDKTTKWLSTF